MMMIVVLLIKLPYMLHVKDPNKAKYQYLIKNAKTWS